MSSAGRGEEDVVDLGIGGGPVAVRVERFGTVTGGLRDWGQEGGCRCLAVKRFKGAVVVRPGGLEITGYDSNRGDIGWAPTAVAERFEGY